MKKYTIHKIIAPINLSKDSSAAPEWAAQLSKMFQAQLVLYNAVRPESDEGQLDTVVHGSKMNQLLKAAVTRLQELGKGLVQAHRVSYSVEVGANWRNLVEQAQTQRTDLLINGLPPAGQNIPSHLTALMYSLPCPALFVREGMELLIGKRVLVPVRIKDGIKATLPVVATWANAFGSPVVLSAFTPDGSSAKEKLQLDKLTDEMSQILLAEGITAHVERAHGFHFGTAMLERAKQLDAGMIVVGIEPERFLSRLFSQMAGPFFIKNSPVPVLSVPLSKKSAILTAPDAREQPMQQASFSAPTPLPIANN